MTDREVRVVLPEPHYTLFNATREDLPEVISVNDSLVSFAHADVFPWYLRVTIDAQDLVENGMPSPGESELLFEIGDEIEAVILGGRTKLGSQNALFLARSTWNAVRELRYQVHDPEITHNALHELLVSRDWPRPWDYEMKCEPEWTSAGYVLQLFNETDSSTA